MLERVDTADNGRLHPFDLLMAETEELFDLDEVEPQDQDVGPESEPTGHEG